MMSSSSSSKDKDTIKVEAVISTRAEGSQSKDEANQTGRHRTTAGLVTRQKSQIRMRLQRRWYHSAVSHRAVLEAMVDRMMTMKCGKQSSPSGKSHAMLSVVMRTQ